MYTFFKKQQLFSKSLPKTFEYIYASRFKIDAIMQLEWKQNSNFLFLVLDLVQVFFFLSVTDSSRS